VAPESETLLAVMPRPRTACLIDGRVMVQGVRFTDALPSHERHSQIRDKTLAGGEMSTSGLVRAHAAGASLVALPVFLKRGFSHPHVVTRADAPLTSPSDLVGRRVGVNEWDSSIMVWLRGLFKDAYDIDQSAVRWVLAGDPPTNAATVDFEALPHQAAEDPRWTGHERIDGVRRSLRSSERRLLALLVSGSLDAVLSTTIPEGPGLRCIFGDRLAEAEADWHRSTGIYPINHTLVVQAEVLADRPELADDLIHAFQTARREAGDPTPTLAAETDIIGADPFTYTYGDGERRVLQRFIEYHVAQGLIEQAFDADELFTVRRTQATTA